MSRTMSVVLLLIVLVCTFVSGFLTATVMDAEKKVGEADEKTLAVRESDEHRATSMDTNLVNLRGAEQIFQTGVYDDMVKSDDLLYRVLRLSDGMHVEATPDTADRNTLTAQLRAAEAKNAGLSDSLRDALKTYRTEARRANEVTRELNLCITQQGLDRAQLRAAQQSN